MSTPIATTVHKLLEYMKVIPVPEDQWERYDHQRSAVPPGEGLPLSIVCLPDLVVDINREAIEPSGPTSSSRIFHVGGRAAGVASVLVRLMADKDGAFKPHLMAKSATLAKMVFMEEIRECGSEAAASMCFDTVSFNKGGIEPRCALRGGGAEAKSSKPHQEHELSPKDLSDPECARRLQEANVIYLASITTPNFKGLFQSLSKHLLPIDKEHRPYLVLDCTRGVRDNNGRDYIRDMLDVLNDDELLGIDVLIMPRAMQDRVLQQAGVAGDLTHQLSAFCNGLNEVKVLSYSTEPQEGHDCLDSISLVSLISDDQGNTELQKLECRRSWGNVLHLHEEQIVCMKTGFALVAGIYKAFLRLKDFSGKDNLLASLGANPPWEAAMQYGVELALAQKIQGKTLIQTISDTEAYQKLHGDKARPENFRGSDSSATVKIKKDRALRSNRLCLEGGLEEKMSTLAALRRTGRLNELKLSCCCEPQSRCSQYDCERYEGKRAAVMIDLDGTLMDSTRERIRAVRNALIAIHNIDSTELGQLNPGLETLSQKMDLFVEVVYDMHELYAALKLADFRKEWNHWGWYAVYLFFAFDHTGSGEPSYKSLGRFGKNVSKLKACLFADWEKSKKRGPKDHTKFIRKWSDFVADIWSLEVTHHELIELARNAFRRTRLYPYKEAPDFLQSLIDSDAFDLYVVTEGMPKTQWHKLVSTGLSQYFDRAQVLTTGDASEPEDFRAGLDRDRQCVQSELDRIERERLSLLAARQCLDRLQGGVEDVIAGRDIILCESVQNKVFNLARRELGSKRLQCDKQIEELRKQKKVIDFVARVVERMAWKEGASFYAAVMRAILRDPKAPLNVIRNFKTLIEPLRNNSGIPAKRKFVMIGDRQDKDIDPLGEIIRPTASNRTGFLSFRILAGKYYNQSTEDTLSPPTFVVDTLSQAKAIMLSNEIWKNDNTTGVPCQADPPFFNWTLSFDNPEKYPSIFPDIDGYSRSDFSIGPNWIVRGLGMQYQKGKVTYRTVSAICMRILLECIESSAVDSNLLHRRLLKLLMVIEEVGSDDRGAILKSIREGLSPPVRDEWDQVIRRYEER